MKLLAEMENHSIAGRLKLRLSLGMAPVKLLEEIAMTRSADMLKTPGGTGPERLLSCSIKYRSIGKEPMQPGTRPDRQAIVAQVEKIQKGCVVEQVVWDGAGEVVGLEIQSLEPGEVHYGGWDAAGERIVAEIEEPEARQPSYSVWD